MEDANRFSDIGARLRREFALHNAVYTPGRIFRVGKSYDHEELSQFCGAYVSSPIPSLQARKELEDPVRPELELRDVFVHEVPDDVVGGVWYKT